MDSRYILKIESMQFTAELDVVWREMTVIQDKTASAIWLEKLERCTFNEIKLVSEREKIFSSESGWCSTRKKGRRLNSAQI